jgi:hypothetical protein
LSSHLTYCVLFLTFSKFLWHSISPPPPRPPLCSSPSFVTCWQQPIPRIFCYLPPTRIILFAGDSRANLSPTFSNGIVFCVGATKKKKEGDKGRWCGAPQAQETERADRPLIAASSIIVFCFFV